MTPLEQCAQEFWQLFSQERSVKSRQVDLSDVGRIRYLSMLGYTALDAALSNFWKQRILEEWNELLCLASILLEDDEELASILAKSNGLLSKGQLVSTLRFLHNTGEPERFSPTFVDVGVTLLLVDNLGPTQSKESLAQILFKLQKTRNACFHTGKPLNEIQAFEGLKLLESFAGTAADLHPSFAAAFGVRGAEIFSKAA